MSDLRRLVVAAASLIPLGAVNAAQVHHVGPTGDFATVAAAVSLAADGDIVVVQSTTSQAVVIDGKGITLVAVGPAKPKLASIVVRNVPVTSQVVVRGFLIEAPLPNQPPSVTLRIESCDGAVRIEDCVAKPGLNSLPDTAAAAIVDTSVDVTFVRCTLNGGNGFAGYNEFPGGNPADPGAAALRIIDSRVAVMDSTLIGGYGGDPNSIDGEYSYSGAAGGPAIRMIDGDVFCSESLLKGGNAGSAACKYDLWLGLFICGAEGQGGHCIANAAGLAVVLDDTFDPGGSNGRYSQNPIVKLGGAARSLRGDAVAGAGAASTLLFSGEPGDVVLAFGSTVFDQELILAYSGPILLGAPFAFGPIAFPAASATGTSTASITIPQLAPFTEGLSVAFQAAAIDAISGRIFATSTTVTTMLTD